MDTFKAFMPTLLILLATAIGSVCLAWMPAGSSLRRRPRDWAALAALAFMLGLLVLWLAALCRMPLWALATVGAILLAVRFALRPHALAPRHETTLAAESTFARAASLVAWFATIASLFAPTLFGLPHSNGPDAFTSVLLLATIVMIDAGLASARCRALVRAAAVSAFGAVVACSPTRFDGLDGYAPLYFAVGAVSTIAWYRRADRRALILAAVFFAATIALAREGWLLAAAGMLTLVIGTAAASRKLAIGTCAAAVLVFAAVRVLDPGTFTPTESVVFSNTLYALIGALFAVVLVARWWDLRGLRMPRWNPSGAGVGHERAMLLRTLLFALMFAWIARALRLDVRPDFALLPALFALVILFGSSLERVCDRG
ncbi:MAG: hypothetical protein SGI72_11900 [Planctomycetota bacterium]|nr:hypothetical protein [Planctomycetota bacterium]